MSEDSQARIHSLLDHVEAERGVRILYACESGSRAWGFASPDSDYDIRFLFAHPEDSYLRVAAPFDTVELPLLDGDLDAGGWDVRKALGLQGKSNGALVEWLHSPIVYREAPGFRERWRRAAREVFSPAHSAVHYRGLAKQMLRGKLCNESVRAKDYLYALRAALAARWVLAGRGIPPVPFAEMLGIAPDVITALVPGLLAHKASTMEGERMARMPELDAFLESSLADGESTRLRSAFPNDSRARLDQLFVAEIRDCVPEAAADYTLERVRRPNREFLLRIRAGEFAYEELLAKAENLYAGLPSAFAASGLPDEPDRARVNELLVRVRRAFPGSEETVIAPKTNPTIAGMIQSMM